MSRPPRPPAITAAVVLLIVVGSQIALGAVAILIWVCLDLIETKQPQVPILASLCVLAFLLARDFYRTGVRLVRGTFETSWEVTERYLFHRAVAVVGSLAVGGWGLLALLFHPMDRTLTWLQTTGGTVLSAVFLSVWLNTAALIVACSLCAKHAGAYSRWRAAVDQPAEDAAA